MSPQDIKRISKILYNVKTVDCYDDITAFHDLKDIMQGELKQFIKELESIAKRGRKRITTDAEDAAVDMYINIKGLIDRYAKENNEKMP